MVVHPVVSMPIEVVRKTFADPSSCAACHADQHESWRASYHSSMTRPADAESIEADFENVTLRGFGQVFALRRRGARYFVELDDPYAVAGGSRVEREIVLVTGSHHEQVYWFAAERGRSLGMLPFVYIREERMWVPYPLNMICPPTDVDAYQATPTGMWNSACIACHTTYGRPRPIDDQAADSDAVALGVSCQACHGPAGAHVDFHLAAKVADPMSKQDVVVPVKLPHDRSSQVCGRCHSEFEFHNGNQFKQYLREGIDYRPGDDLDDFIAVARPELKDQPPFTEVVREQPQYFESKFWPDGQTRISGREYNGMTLSPCFTRGEMSCMSCHQMHQENADPRDRKQWADDQLAFDFDGDRACLQCHGDYADRVVEHSHHVAASPGARCMNCHMPHTSYGLLKASRSHTVDSPSVRTTLRVGRLNACNLCHLDRTLAWTAEHLHEWYETPVPELTDEQKVVPAVLIQLLAGDAAQRALATWHLGWPAAVAASDADWAPLFLAQALNDPVPAVRIVAWRAIRKHELFADFPFAPFGPARQRFEAGQALRRQWYADGNPFRLTDLLDGAGDGLSVDIFRELHSRRDDRPIFLGE